MGQCFLWRRGWWCRCPEERGHSWFLSFDGWGCRAGNHVLLQAQGSPEETSWLRRLWYLCLGLDWGRPFTVGISIKTTEFPWN